MDILEIVRQTIIEFCCEFIRHPYMCYTEYGQHALLYTKLYNSIPQNELFMTWKRQKVCILQSEYRTAESLGKSKRQHWDISVYSTPPISKESTSDSYDYLKILCGIEFGLNEPKKHLEDDINRLCHQDANMIQGFIVHLYRLSDPKSKFSRRDWSPNSKRILSPKQVANLSMGTSVKIFYGMADSTNKHEIGVWFIKEGKELKIK